MKRDTTHASPLNGTGRSSYRALASVLRCPSLTWALTLALVGWSVAGVAVLGDVQEHQVARSLAAAAGLTAIPGSGIEIVLTDAASASSSGEVPRVALVQDGDVVLLNMMLWYGGAQAVAVNGERITAQTTIVSSGPTLLINGRRTVGPFHVTAIGDPVVLRGAVEARGGVLDSLRQSGLGVLVTTKWAMVVAAGVSEQWGHMFPPRDSATPRAAEMDTP